MPKINQSSTMREVGYTIIRLFVWKIWRLTMRWRALYILLFISSDRADINKPRRYKQDQMDISVGPKAGAGSGQIWVLRNVNLTENTQVLAWWFLQITTDFTIYVAVLGAWYAYKESSWIIALVLMVPMYFLGCIISIGYILTQFYKLSPEESSTDPLYFVLARRQKSMWLDILTLLFLKNIGHRDVVGYLDTGRHSVVAARVIYSALGCVAFGTLTYSVYVDLSPSYIKYFTSCILTNGTDMYIHVVIFSVWLAYKESSNWITAFFWILLLFCFRGYLDANDPPLMAHPSV
ncbi:reverse transcriptase, RNA-dependent DNA polymerase [Artemisia annua]|uniref:Reverse transcriptase, RNA-dependent DNA polymerase n=1 Tax=Artemisia annua TaxID=35608 RepID=A0A2U1QB62_ARTAN|nr:reverse transcriptase, RNA-dependent DNA polymerase [Artemisia annua]